jgi:mannan endo-1,6-alpha-mannosidase
MKFSLACLATTATAVVVAPKDLDLDSRYSIRNVAATIANDALTYYNGNVSANPVDLGDLTDPYYWWVAGNLWGVMLDYYHTTGDPSYNQVVIDALLSPTNLGPNHDFVPPEHAFEQGNDDLSFWGTAALTAAERNFPQPDESLPSWLEIGENVFNSLHSRWNTSACGGGLLWQIYPDNPNGLDYRNSVSNGGFFQIAARLARATGNDTYAEWANKIWDWTYDIGLIEHDTYHVWDGASSRENCSVINEVSFTYTGGIYLYAASVMANYTESDIWAERAEKLLAGTEWFFNPPNKTGSGILNEAACEPYDTCNADMETHKGTLANYMWQSTLLQPNLRPKVEMYMRTTAMAAAQSCTGGESGHLCGRKWYEDGFDGTPGLGNQMSALQVIQGFLIDDAAPPLTADKIKVVRNTNFPPLDTYEPDPQAS